METIQPVILCGGSGTRLWPLSREQHPKPLHAINGERTLLQETALRVPGSSIVVCNEHHRFLVRDQLKRIKAPVKSILLEPAGRGTAPALTMAAIQAVMADDPVLLAMPSDHVITDRAAFQKAVDRAAGLAARGRIVVFGVPAVSAETGYGYVKARGEFVEAFVEKPDAARAKQYVEDKYLWNSGIFAVRASVWIDAIGCFRKEILDACQRAWRAATRDAEFVRIDEKAFAACPSDSIDYAVMERLTDKSVDCGTEAGVVPLAAGWSDVGAWDALWGVEEKDGDGNVIHGDVHAADTKNALLIAQHRMLACVGLEDVVVVETPDAVMVARKDKAQSVGGLVAKLKQAGREECRVHRKVHRPWGTYDGIEKGERFQVKRIVVDPGASLSLQMHYHRAEHWIVVRGTARVTRGDETFLLTENESTYIPPGTRHRLENPGRLPLELIEVQSGAYLGEDDIVRFEDAYGRKQDRGQTPNR